MRKEAYYFSHDSNARNDEKILSLRMKHGMEGYGIYWSIIEMLRDTKNYTMQLECERIAFELHSDCEVIKSVINNFNLFEIKDNFFYSKSLLRRMEIREKKSKKARESALKRWNNDANALRSDCKGNALKEIKRKEIKRKDFDFKKTTEKEVIEKYGEYSKEHVDHLTKGYVNYRGLSMQDIVDMHKIRVERGDHK